LIDLYVKSNPASLKKDTSTPAPVEEKKEEVAAPVVTNDV
jgi:hypothetical protein